MRAYSISPRPTVPPRKPRPGAEPANAIRDVNQHVAHRLKMLRIITGRTQTDLGTAMGKTFQQMAKYERGISRIAPDMLWRLAEYFQVDIGYFFADLERATPNGDLRMAEHLATRKQLRLELVTALDAITDENLLRGLRAFLRISQGHDRDE